MTTQGEATTEQENNELTPEQQAAEDAAFEAGFAAVAGTEPGAAATTSEDDAETNTDDNGEPANDGDEQARKDAEAAAALEAERAAAEEAERKAREAEEAPVTITKGQFDKLMAIANEVPNLREQMTKTHDTVAGRIGSLQQTIKTLQERAGKGSVASIKQLKRLEEEFPQLATLLKEDLSEALGSAGTDAAADQLDKQQQNDAPLNDQQGDKGQEQNDPLQDPRVQQVLQRQEMAIVEAVHPGFLEMAKTPEFSEWKATLPPVAVNLLDNSWDARNVMIPAFNDFKKWKADKEAKAAAAASTKQQNDKRLERAIAPTDGAARTGQHVVDEDAAFEAGFKSVRGG